MNNNICPFELKEIAVFTSYIRQEVYISTIMQIHIDNWGKGWIPEIRKATSEEKMLWYENDSYELNYGVCFRFSVDAGFIHPNEMDE